MNHVYEFSLDKGIVSAIITLLIATLLVHFAAKIVTDKSSFLIAALVAILGSIFATFIWGLIGGIWGQVAALAGWALIAALFYRTAWIKGALIGVTAWILWFLVNLVVRALS